MKNTRILVVTLTALIAAFAATTLQAQGNAPAAGASAATPAPGMGMGMGPGKGAGMMQGNRGPAARWGANYTPGWALMSTEERSAHRAKMMQMTSYDECKTYHDQQHEQMLARAKDKGVKLPPAPLRDACARLKK